MGVADWLFGDAPINSKKTKRAEQGYQNILGTLKGRLGDADRRAGMSVRDLYGDSIDRSADMVRSNANATKSALTRLGSARGADVTGAQNSVFNRVDENANENVSNIIQHYSDRASTDREQAQARGDRLVRSQGSMQSQLANLANAELQRKLQKRQANSSLFGDVIGAVGSIVGGGLSGGGGG